MEQGELQVVYSSDFPTPKADESPPKFKQKKRDFQTMSKQWSSAGMGEMDEHVQGPRAKHAKHAIVCDRRAGPGAS